MVGGRDEGEIWKASRRQPGLRRRGTNEGEAQEGSTERERDGFGDGEFGG